MSISKCSKCGKSMFQIESLTPIGSKRDIITVICHACNTIVGTMEYSSHNEDEEDFKLQIQVLNNKLDTINNNLGQLLNGVRLLYNKIEDVKKS